MKIKDNWSKNLADVQVPHEVINLLSLGCKFNFPPLKKEISVIKVLADVEYSLNYIIIKIQKKKYLYSSRHKYHY